MVNPHGPFRHGKSEAPVAVDDSGRRALFDDFELGARDDVPPLHPFDVEGDVDDPVGIVTRQVRTNAVPRDDFGFDFQRACRPQQLAGERFQCRCQDSGHCETLLTTEAIG